MPYIYYTKATRADVMAIRAWLNTVTPVANSVHANTLPFPFNIRAGMAAATYLLDQTAGKETPPTPVAANDPVMRAGESIYADECSACHKQDGRGIARLIPSLRVSPFVQQSGAASVLHVIVEGTRAVSTAKAPTGAAMPAFGWKRSDEQVATVTTYIRNSWGNAASTVSAGDVRSAHQSALAE